MDRTLRMAARLQPVDAGEVAQLLVDQITAGPAGRLPDLVGPQVLTLGEMARTWMDVRRTARRLIRLPIPGRLGQPLRRGDLTEPGARHGSITWAEWLSQSNPN